MMSKHKASERVQVCRSAAIFICVAILAQTINSNLKLGARDFSAPETTRSQWDKTSSEGSSGLVDSIGPPGAAFGPFAIFGFAEAKKKKEKSEVVVISVTNPQQKSRMYPVFIPSCGGGGGGHHGYGRRRRR